MFSFSKALNTNPNIPKQRGIIKRHSIATMLVFMSFQSIAEASAIKIKPRQGINIGIIEYFIVK